MMSLDLDQIGPPAHLTGGRLPRPPAPSPRLTLAISNIEIFFFLAFLAFFYLFRIF